MKFALKVCLGFVGFYALFSLLFAAQFSPSVRKHNALVGLQGEETMRLDRALAKTSAWAQEFGLRIEQVEKVLLAHVQLPAGAFIGKKSVAIQEVHEALSQLREQNIR